jgi:hypothetical protein
MRTRATLTLKHAHPCALRPGRLARFTLKLACPSKQGSGVLHSQWPWVRRLGFRVLGFGAPIVTEVKPFAAFWPAEPEHLDYYRRNQQQPYCAFVISPKVAKVRKKFAERVSGRKP